MKITQVADLSSVKRYSIKGRKSKVSEADFAQVPKKGSSFLDFYSGLPNILQSAKIKELVDALVLAREKGKPIYWMLGGHVIKVGLAPVLIRLMEGGWVQGLAMNSAASIHDSEIARFGETSEDVDLAIEDGSFGMAKETSVEYLQALMVQRKENLGWGEKLAVWLDSDKIEYRKYSLLAACSRLDIPVTVHGALGTDIIWQHPECDGSVLGKLGEMDFKKFISLLKDLENGALLNWGSAVIMPEIFLKAFTVARNLGAHIEKFSTANFDQIQHYRPRVNILNRPTSLGGKSFAITAHHELIMPFLAQALVERE